MRRRLLSLFLTLTMLLSMVPATALAAESVDTAIYSGTDWPYSSYYIASLTLTGPEVSYIDGTTVYLDSKTAAGAEFTLTAAAGGSSSGNLGVNWNDDSTNTKTYTTSLVDGTASVKIYAYKASGAGVSRNGTKTFTFQIAEPNETPTLADGVSAEATESVTSGTAYEVDLSTIFADADGDALTYTVSVNGAAAAAADASYSYLNTVPGTYELKFVATDGKTLPDKQPTYTVTLTVQNSETTYDVNVAVPEGVSPAFYAVNTVTSGAVVKGDELTYTDGVVKVPENITRIMWEAENVTGFSVPVSSGANVALVNVTFAAEYDSDPAESVAIEVKDSEGVKVTGTGTDTYLLPAVSGFTYKATAAGTNGGNYNAVEFTDQTPSSGAVKISFNRKHFTVTAPKGSVVSAGTLNGSFAYSFAAPISSVEEGETVVYKFAPLSGNAFVRVQHPDKDAVTYWDWKSSKADGKSVVVTEEMLFMGDAASGDAFNSDTIYRNFEKFEMDLGDIYMNINNQGYINVNVGESKGLNMFRNWQAIESFTNAKISLPDFAYEVIALEGNDVIEITPDANNSAAATLTAKNEGTAIVLVTYDAMYSDSTVKNSNGDAGDGNRYTAIWPDRTGVFVVSVGKDGTAIKSNMTCNGAVFDAEHSPQFYVGDQGASVSFTPDEGVTVTVNRSTVGAETLSFGQFTDSGVTVDPESGEVTVSGLKTGRHIIKLEKDGVASYQVVTAQQVTVAFIGADGRELGDAPTVAPGGSLTLKIKGLTNPAEKFATKYNFNAQVTYKDENGNTYKNSSGAAYGKYNFSSQEQIVSVTVPSDWEGETMTLNGYIQMGGFSGGAIGDHRKVSYGTASGMATGSGAGMVLGTLPELVINIKTVSAESLTLDKTEVRAEADEPFTLTAVLLPANSTDTVEWISGDETIATVENGVVTGQSAGTTTITAKAGELTAVCTVEVYGTKKEINITTGSSGSYYLTNIDIKGVRGTVESSEGKAYTILLDSRTETTDAIDFVMTANRTSSSRYFWVNSNKLRTYDGNPGTISIVPEWNESKEAVVTVRIANSSGGTNYDGPYTFNFKIAEPTKPAKPFLSIKIGDEEVTEDKIAYKGIFELGDYAADEQQETPDNYDYVHSVPYYHVTVPCGTEYVDVTYSAETDIMNYGSDAYGYKTDLEFDAVSSATVRGTTFKDGYTKNEDGTQTVKTPVTGYTFDAEGNGHAITLEENASPYAAVCLFSFAYEGKDHVFAGKVTKEATCTEAGEKTFTCTCGESYTEPVDALGHSYAEGACTVCGAADPDYVAPGGAAIPAGAPFTALTTDAGAVGKIESKGPVTYTGYTPYENVPYYHVTIPAGATEVYVTHPASEDPFADTSYNSAYGYYAETEGWTGSGMSYAFKNAEDGYTITLPLSASATNWETGETTELSFVADANGTVSYAVGVERNDYTPICFFTFEYTAAGEGEHTHSYTEEVTKAPTCTEAGEKTFTCACSDSYTEEIPASGHSYDAGVETTAATCVADGEKTFTCSVCDENTEGHTKTEKIGKLGHDYDEGKVTKAPTCTEAGEKTFTCQREGCTEETADHTRTETIPASGHSYVDGTCTACGDVCPQQDENGVYQIGTAKELLWFANAVNNGQTGISGVLTADIDLADVAWPGIGTSSKRFAGTFDGGGKTVTFHDAPHGLIAYAFGASSDNPAVVKNVTTAGTISGLAGVVEIARSSTYGKNAYVRIQKCVNLADVTSAEYAAGIVADARGDVKIEECANLGRISGEAGDRVAPGVGGIVGYIQGYPNGCSLTDCYNLGKIVNSSGNALTGGLIGNMYNAVTLTNSYNAGEVNYAIAGRVFNKTDSISNTYYLSTKSPESVPSTDLYDSVQISAKSLAEITSAEFAATLGQSFQQSCPGPVFTWQTAAAHQLDSDGTCTVCGLGTKQTFAVTLNQGEGYTISGADSVKEGASYTFTVAISEGYEKSDSFAVKVGGTAVTGSDDTYTVENVSGPLIIAVEGVSKIPETYAVTRPGEGEGYRVTPCDGYSDNSAARDGDYQFTVTFVDGFQAGEDFKVKANGVELVGKNGVYTITGIRADQTITVEGVDLIPCEDTTDVTFTITEGTDKFYTAPNNEIIADLELKVPYFDLELYGLEQYYYNPYCYVDKDGEPAIRQTAGTRETAYGVVTAIHAYIYLTEIYHLNMDPEVAGTGLSYEQELIQDAISWTGGAGSSFMDLWNHGTNLNYYVNYMYPLGRPAWGATSDQIALQDGDVISVHMIKDTKVSGSNFAFFTVNDEDQSFDFSKDQVDSAAVKQGEKLELTMYWAGPNGQYITGYSRMKDQDLYWIEGDNFCENVLEWYQTDFAGLTAGELVTDANGCVVLDTTDLAPGVYYIAAVGGITDGGMVDEGGFVSRGNETGSALFRLTVESHTYDNGTVTTDPTCTEAGVKTYTCTCCKEAHSYTEEIPATGHTEETVAGKVATCTETGLTEGKKCTVCGEIIVAQETIPAQGHTEETVAGKAATCTEPGLTEGKKCTVCGETTVAQEEIPAQGHSEETVAGKDATCTETGLTEGKKCTVCGEAITAQEEIPAQGHDLTKVEAKAATTAAPGNEAYWICEACGKLFADENGTTETTLEAVTLPKLQEPIVVPPVVTPSRPVQPSKPSQPTTPVVPEKELPFIDVAKTNWAYSAIEYVYDNGIMTGVTSITFEPTANLTRAMLWTMLARAEGVNTSGASPWYATAQKWAMDNGVSDGTAPNGNITREQLVTILYRYAGSPAVSGSLSDYPDAASVSDYAVDAMIWAVETGLINGIDGKLAPKGFATRAQVATILMRFLESSK